MTLRELMDTCENDLEICEDGYSYPFLTIRQMEDCNSCDFKDFLSEEFLNSEVASFKRDSFNNTIKVNLWEGLK